MLDDFFTRALLAGLGVALICGPLGCFIIWRRMAYFGDTMAHSALLGVALGLLLNINLIAGVFAVAALCSGLLIYLERRRLLPTDAILGILSHSTLALGLVALAFMSWLRVDLMAFLFGDILAVSHTDIAVIYAGAVLILAALIAIWRPLMASTVSAELAAAEGINPDRYRLFLMLLLAGVIAIAMKIIGILLITALLIIPAATARQIAKGPEQMVFLAAGFGVLAVASGLAGSLRWDTPSGPSIVVAALLLFILCHVLPVADWLQNRRREESS